MFVHTTTTNTIDLDAQAVIKRESAKENTSTRSVPPGGIFVSRVATTLPVIVQTHTWCVTVARLILVAAPTGQVQTGSTLRPREVREVREVPVGLVGQENSSRLSGYWIPRQTDTITLIPGGNLNGQVEGGIAG